MSIPAPVQGEMIPEAIVLADKLNASPANPPYDGSVELKFGDKVYGYYNLTYDACVFRVKKKSTRYYFALRTDNFAVADSKAEHLIDYAKALDRQIDKLTRERKRLVENKFVRCVREPKANGF